MGKKRMYLNIGNIKNDNGEKMRDLGEIGMKVNNKCWIMVIKILIQKQ
jgi:hypothetical protein